VQYHSRILITSTKTKPEIQQALAKLIPFKNILQHPDVTWIEETPSIGIATIRSLIGELQQSPFQEQYKVAIIVKAETLTAESQHALLKTLEEPPENTQLILVTSTLESLLPTIVSRCQTQTLSAMKKIDQEVSENIRNVVKHFSQKDVFTLSEELGKGREEAVVFMHQLCQELQKKLALTPSQETIKDLQQTIFALRRLHANCHTKLTLESLFFHLSTCK